MEGEVSAMLFKAEQEYLKAKERYEEFRDGYMPYLDDKKEYEAELERLMREMDAAEDLLETVKGEYDDVMRS
ncbi:MAG: hypothetical protein J6031_03245 [Bacteroidales bacterium]|nr:hypothetical protein [Bacteroidales bacterium]